MTANSDRESTHRASVERDWYEIEVEGQVHPLWFSWLDDWAITSLPNGNTLLAGYIVDQPALHGLFACIRDMNLKIISLKISKPIPSTRT